MSSQRDIVLFLGAGFSKDAGLPIIRDFGPFAEEEYETILREHFNVDWLSNKFRYNAPMLVEAADVFMKFQKYCGKSHTLSGNDDINNLETIFCLAEILYESNIESINLGGNEYALSEILNHIRIWLWKIYSICRLVDVGKVPADKEYNEFFRYLKDENLYRKLNVITTNYDLIFEYMTWKNDLQSIYPITINECEQIKLVSEYQKTSSAHYYVQYCQDPLAEEQEYINTNAPYVHKLHGSVNYFSSFDDNGNTLMISDDVSDGSRIQNSRLRKGLPAILAFDAFKGIKNKYGRFVMPMIIPPTYSKLTGHPWLRQIWNSSINALSRASKIIYIGYSIPESDGFMRAMLHGAMTMRKDGSLPKVYVIDPSEATHSKYYDLYKNAVQPIKCQTFIDAVKNGTIYEILSE